MNHRGSIPGAASAAILTYHRVMGRDRTAPQFYDVSLARFRHQMALLTRRVTRIQGPRLLLENGRSIYLTFDDGTLDHATVGDVLQAFGLVGVFFIVTARVGSSARLSWADLRRLAGQGHRLGSHTVTHRPLPRLSNAEIVEELKISRTALESVAGAEVQWLAPPGGHLCQRSLAIVRGFGFEVTRTMEWGYTSEPPMGVTPCLPVLPFLSLGGFERILDHRATVWPYELKRRLKGLIGERLYVTGRDAVARLRHRP
jgi:peptidoglycan/xylan/chitin deacetylase (PgdA/CDA1 family)